MNHLHNCAGLTASRQSAAGCPLERPIGGPPRRFARIACLAVAGGIAAAAVAADVPLPGWKHTGTLMLLTTPAGAHLPAGAVVEEFPVLVRLDRDWFDFARAKPEGADVRFTTAAGITPMRQAQSMNRPLHVSLANRRGPAIVFINP